MKRFLLAAAGLLALSGPALAAVTAETQVACSTARPDFAASAGGFAMMDAQMYDPSGQPWQARGINVMGWDQNAAMAAPDLFPGLNLIRLAIYDYTDPAKLQPFIDKMTSRGIVVLLENHNNGAGNAGGGQGEIFTGAALATEQAWYSKVAGAFARNPYVWFGTNNEPPAGGAALADWQKRTYDTIRAAGNNNPVALEVTGWDPGSMNADLPADRYATMTNTFIDLHYYGWVSKYSTDQATVDRNLAEVAAGAQRLHNRDGRMPVFIGEYGNSTTGQAIDANGNQVVRAVAKSGFGSAAWAWGAGNPGDGLLNGGGLSDYGRMVADFIRGSGAPGCALAPIGDVVYRDGSQVLTQDQAVAQSAQDILPQPAPAAPASIDDTAKLALSDVQSDGPSVAELAALIERGAPKVDAPAGEYTPPEPPTAASTPLTVAGDFGMKSDVTGPHTVSVTGNGNVTSLTGGPQTVTVSGIGNAIRLGMFNDRITVRTSGNTIDGGGGEDLVILDYPKTPGAAVATVTLPTATLATLALSKSGNVFVAPAPGQGVLTIQGQLAKLDSINLSRSVSGLAPGTARPYTVTQTATGSIITVRGKPVVVVEDGLPAASIAPLITTKAIVAKDLNP